MTQSSPSSLLIIGLGATGLATARYCSRKGWAFDVCDSRQSPPGLEEAMVEFPTARIMTGELSAEVLTQYQRLIISPGVALATPAIQAAIAAGVDVVGDVELFLRASNIPVIAITGSNGKSTVTELVAAVLEKAGKSVLIGGNIGVPVLDLLNEGSEQADFAVLELSSFQLETTHQVNAVAAVLLNLSEDHMDRYDSMDDYLAAKQRIFTGCQCAVINLDDYASSPECKVPHCIGFGLSAPEGDRYGIVRGDCDGVPGSWIVRGEQKLVHSSRIALKGSHNFANVMAALALVDACGVDLKDTIPALAEFKGLDHRCQPLGRVHGVEFINDSKGTNVGSTLAAVEGLASDCSGTVHLLMGGDGKGQDFLPLLQGLQAHPVAAYVFGAESDALDRLFQGKVPCQTHKTLSDAFRAAVEAAVSGDIVLLSPACASFDQFRNYIERGLHFEQLVRALK